MKFNVQEFQRRVTLYRGGLDIRAVSENQVLKVGARFFIWNNTNEHGK